MTFLNPLALFGLLAAALPVLLHILTLRRLRTVEFSTLRFLKELQRTRIRRLKVRQILLLILRTLLVVLIVVAFSRPTLQGSMAGGSHARTTAVLILDDTPSMNATGENGELFTQAKTAASQILDLLQDGDDAALLRVSEAGSAEVPVPMQSVPTLRTYLKDTRPVLLSRTTEEAVRAAARVLTTSKNFNKEIYVFSDLQSGTIEPSPASPPERLFDSRTRVYVLPLSAGNLRNASVEEVRLPDVIRETGRPVTVRLRVANHNSQTIPNHVVSLFVGGARVAQRGIEIPGGGRAETELSFTPASAGILNGIAEIEDDDLEFDNRRYFTVTIPPQLRVLLAGTPADLQFAQLALGTRLSDSAQTIQVEQLVPERLTGTALTRADVVVLVNPGLLPPAVAQSLAEFVRVGGGLVLFPGPRMQPQTYQASFGSMSLPPMAGLDRVSASPAGEAAFIALDQVDWRHPVFRHMFEDAPRGRRAPGSSSQGERTLESPEIRTAVRFVPGPRSTVIVGQTNGAPFLIEHAYGQGRILLFSVTATREWSDLPLRGMFVPLLHRSALSVSRQRQEHPPAVVGESVNLPMGDASQTRVTVADPSGGESNVMVSTTGTGASVRLPETSRPGFYTVRSKGTVLDVAALNVDARESDTAPAERSRLERMFSRLGLDDRSVVFLTPGGDHARSVNEARYGMELWRYVLMAALITALAELAVARDTKRAARELEHSSLERTV